MKKEDRYRDNLVVVLQRFVRMSRMLLPSLSELNAKEDLTSEEKTKVKRIKEVYDAFKASPDISIRLINSNILQLIADAYRTARSEQGLSPQTFYTYNAFLEESDRLINEWNLHKMN